MYLDVEVPTDNENSNQKSHKERKNASTPMRKLLNNSSTTT